MSDKHPENPRSWNGDNPGEGAALLERAPSAKGSAAKEKIAKSEKIVIPSLEIEQTVILIRGTTDFIMNKFSEKSQLEMEGKKRGVASQAKAFKDPHALFLGAQQVTPDGFWFMPASAFKAAALYACQYVDLFKTYVAGAFHILESDVRIFGRPVRRDDVARNANGIADVRSRPYFLADDGWCARFTVRYNSRALNAQQIHNLFNNAGFASGIGDWRPSSPKNKSGSHGLFCVCGSSDWEPVRKKHEKARFDPNYKGDGPGCRILDTATIERMALAAAEAFPTAAEPKAKRGKKEDAE